MGPSLATAPCCPPGPPGCAGHQPGPAGVGLRRDGRRFLLPPVLAALAEAAAVPERLCPRLGLDGGAALALMRRHAPDLEGILRAVPPEVGTGEGAPEEEDLQSWLLDHIPPQFPEEIQADCRWMAAIVARRSQLPNHLWQDMGYPNRDELSAMFQTYFPAVYAANHQNMKWKKFIYRQLCEREGIRACRAPVCDMCDDFAHCFGGEDGQPLLRRALLGH